MRLDNLFFALSIFSILSCGDIPEASEVDLLGSDQSIAIPLINSELKVADLTSGVSGKTSVLIDSDGRLTALYSGNLIGFTSTKIFPPIPGIIDNVLPDTVSSLPLPVNTGHRITKAIFKNSNMKFRFRSTSGKKFSVKMTLPDVSKDGNVWVQNYNVDFSSGLMEVVTSSFLLKDWTVIPVQNNIIFNYDARDENGERVKLDYAAMIVDVLEFKAVEGYFGSNPFDIPGDFINVNLFDRWISGGLELDDPKITLEVENAFGFPVRSKVNKLEFKTKSGLTFPLESQYVDTGINFYFPNVTEQGITKTTYFTFDKDNSNIKQIFNDKVVQVVYDIDAIPNPDFDETVTNFLNDESFFRINVDVAIPMHLKANEFVIGDTLDFNLSDYDNVNNATFKSIVNNGFPVDITLQGYFLNERGDKIDSLFAPESLELPGPEVDGDGIAMLGTDVTKYSEIDSKRFDNIKKSSKILVTATFNNPEQKLRWIFEQYSIKIKIGAIINFKN